MTRVLFYVCISSFDEKSEIIFMSGNKREFVNLHLMFPPKTKGRKAKDEKKRKEKRMMMINKKMHKKEGGA